MKTVLKDSQPRTGSPNDLGRLVTDRLIAKIGPTRFELWFDDRQCIRQSGQSIIISAANDFTLQRMRTGFASTLREIVRQVCGPVFKLEFRTVEESETVESETVESETAETETTQELTDTNHNCESGTSAVSVAVQTIKFDSGANQRSKSSADNKLTDGLNAPPIQQRRRSLSLQTYCFGTENSLAQASAEQVFRQPGRYSPLYVYGPTGSGKSHLLEGLVGDFRRQSAKKRCVYLSSEQFTASFIASLRGAGLPMFRRKYRDVDMLAIDDVQFFEGKRATIGEFQSTIDHLSRLGKQIIVSSDRPPAELSGIAPDLIARLSAGLICPLNYPDREQRVQIVRSFCDERGYRFSPDVIELVAERISGDVRKLSGALNRLHAASVVSGSPMSAGSASEVLVDLFALSGAITSMVRIEKAVCEICQIQPSELKSPSRKKRICTARMLAMYLSRQHTNNAYSEIGDYFGGRSHSTVIAAQKKVTNWIEGEHRIDLPHAAYDAKEILKRIKSSLRVG